MHMKREKKLFISKILSGALCLAMMLSCVPFRAAEAAEEKMVYLSDLEWEWAYASSIGELYGDKEKLPENIGLPKKDVCYGTNASMEMKMQDGTIKKFDKGIGTEASSEIVYKLGKEYETFMATIGFDSYVLGNPNLPSSVQMKVLGSKTEDISSEYEELYSTETIYSGKDESRPYFVPEDIRVDVRGYEYMKLWVSDVNESLSGPVNASDTVNWAEARLVKISVITYEMLNEKIAEAEQKNKKNYTEESWNASKIEQVIEAAKKVTEDASAEEIESVYDQLNEAIGKLVYVGLDSISLSVDNKTLNPVLNPELKAHVSVQAFNVEGEEIPAEETKVSFRAENLYASGENIAVAEVDENGAVTGLEGGVARIFVTVNDGEVEKTASTDIVVRPYYNEYHQTLTMKMFMGEKGNVDMTFEEALETIRKMDNVTRGIPKIIYLVGWQFDGHDSGYPSWDEVNERLKREEDATATDSLRWLMREAKKYNTTVSLHINMLDAQKDSPLWDEYIEKDIIARYEDGQLRDYKWGYPICYTAEWEAGLAQRRINRLVEMLPELKEAGTIHIDAFSTYVPTQDSSLAISPWHEEKYGWGQEEDEETQRKIFRYWREKGIDVTSEAVSWYRNDKFIGLQPMAWHFQSLTIQEYMDIPASLYCGGDGGNALFGNNMQGENIIRNDKETLQGFSQDFALKTVPFYYLNRLDRISYQDGAVTYSDGVVCSENGSSMKKGDMILREGNNIFIPALWLEENHKEIIAYSADGYTDKVWELPDEFSGAEAVDLYEINLKGLAPVKEAVEVKDNKITLSLGKGEMLAIVPAGTDLENIQIGEFHLWAPQNGGTSVEMSDLSFEWESAIGASSYVLQIAKDPEFTDIVYEEETEGCSAVLKSGLDHQTKYYWRVTAKNADATDTKTSAAWSFTMVAKDRPEAPENLKGYRGQSRIELQWENSDSSSVEKYMIYRSDDGGKTFIVLADNVTEKEYADLTEYSDQTVYYVTAVNGKGESEKSREIFVKDIRNQVSYLSDMEWEWAYAQKSMQDEMYNEKENLPEQVTLPQKDMRMDGAAKIQLFFGEGDSRTYDKGIGTEACSEIVYQLDGKYDTFSAVVGFDEYVLTNPVMPSSAQIKVLGSRTEDRTAEYEVLYDSGTVYTGEKNGHSYFMPQELKIDVSGYQYLKLWVGDANSAEATDNSPSNASDTINWANAKLYVEDDEIKAESIELDYNSAELNVGDTLQLNVTVKPDNAVNKKIVWTTSDEDVLTVENGLITAVSVGNAVITATTEDGSLTDQCEVTVSERAPEFYQITVKQSEGGRITPDTVQVESGSSVKFEIKAFDGYEIKDVLVDQKSVGVTSEYELNDIRSSHTIAAVFEKKGGGNVSENPEQNDNAEPKGDAGKTDNFSVRTGDSAPVAGMAIAVAASGLIALTSVLRQKRKRNR